MKINIYLIFQIYYWVNLKKKKSKIIKLTIDTKAGKPLNHFKGKEV